MVRPSQERTSLALTEAQSAAIGDGVDIDDDGADFDGGGNDGGGGTITPPLTQTLEVIDDSTDQLEIDASLSDWWDITLTADCTLTITNPPASGRVYQLHLILRQGAGAPWLVTWPAEVDWPDTDGTGGGAAPTLHTAETAEDVIVLTTEDGGTSWGGTYDGATALTVTDGITTVVPVSEIDFTSGVVVSDLGGGIAGIAVTAASGFLTSGTGEKHVIQSHGSMGSTETLDLANGNVHTGTLDANCTITLTGFTGGVRSILQAKLTENGTGGWTPTFASSGTIVWLGGSTPTHTTTLNTVTEYVFWSDDGGTTIYGGMLGATPVLTVKDEGTPLATSATSLDFVGSSVVASGTGAAKTITITDTTINGVTVSGTPSSGQVLTATSSSAADWETPSASSSSGVDHEHIMNLWYSGDGATTAFELPAAAFDSQSVRVWVSGTLTDVTLSGTPLTTMTFGSAPASATNNIVVDLVAAAA